MAIGKLFRKRDLQNIIWQRTGSGGGVVVDMDEDDGLAFGEDIISGPPDGILAAFVAVDGDGNQSIPHRGFLLHMTLSNPHSLSLSLFSSLWQ